MKIYPAIMILLLVTALSASGLATSRLNTNIIGELEAGDILDDTGSTIQSSVVVGYNAAVTDFIAAANLAIFLTSMNRVTYAMELTCNDIPKEFLIFAPSRREVLFRTDADLQLKRRVLIGGPVTNREVLAYPEVTELLKEPGDMVIDTYGEDVIVAGYTGLDTERAVQYLIDLLRTSDD